MLQFDGPGPAADAIRRFFYKNDDALPEFIRDKIAPFVGQGQSPVDLMVNFTETVYANRDALSPAFKEALEIAAATAGIINEHGWHGSLGGRAARMVPVLRRESGERAPNGTGGWPAKSADPAAADGYALPPEEPAEEETEA